MVPLARRLELAIEIDARLAERNVGDLGVDWEADTEQALAVIYNMQIVICYGNGF